MTNAQITPEQVLQQATEAMKAAAELKTQIERKLDKDAIDLSSIEKMQKSIADAAEASQKLNQSLTAEQKAREDAAAKHEKELKELAEKHGADATRLAQLEAAFQRTKLGGGDGDEEKALRQKLNKAFNEYARKQLPGNTPFSDFLAGNAEFKDLSVNSNPDGGYLITPTYGAMIDGRVFETTPMRSLADVQTVGTDRLVLPLDDDEAAFGWVGEEEDRNDTNTPGIKEIEIPVQEVYAQPKATQKMLDDAAIDIEAWLMKKVSDRFARAENSGFVSGNGIKSPRGILTYPAWAANGSYEAGKLEQIKSGSNGAFTYDGLVDLQNALKEIYQPGSVFLGKRATFGALMKLKDAENRAIFNPMFDKNAGLSIAILGQRFVFADDMPSAANGILALAYGNFGEGYTIVDRAGVRILRDVFTKKSWVKFYATKRTGGAVTNFEAIKLQVLSA